MVAMIESAFRALLMAATRRADAGEAPGRPARRRTV